MRHLLIFAATAALVVAGCGDDDDGGSSEPKAEAKPKVVKLSVNGDGERVQTKSVLVTGEVSPAGATVQVGDKEVTADGGSFKARVPLPDIGENTIFVDARKPGFESAETETIRVTRTLSAAERAARAEKRRQAREARLAELRASAEALDPELFQKDPDRYIGQDLVMTGEIFQIQEGGDNFLLMDTGCTTEYDITICDGPTVYVTYGFPTDATQQDVVTVYGQAMGGYEYDTQIGGSNYVGWIEADIIE